MLHSYGRLFTCLPFLGCHFPPIPDLDLIEIIRAFNEARKSKPDASLNWKCASCLKGKARVINNEPIVVDDDDDDVQIVETPEKPKQIPTENTSSRPSSHSTSTDPPRRATTKVASSKPKDRAVQIIDDPVDYLIPSTPRPPLSQQSTVSTTHSLTSNYTRLSIAESPQQYKPRYQGDDSDDALEYTDTPSPEPRNQLVSSLSKSGIVMRALGSSTSSTNHQGAPSIPTSGSIPASLAMTPVSGSSPDFPNSLPPQEPQERRSTPTSTPTLHPLPIDTSDPISNESHAQVRQPEKPPIFHSSLLPHYINARYRSSENDTESNSKKISDIWYLSAARKMKLVMRSSVSSDPGLHVERKKKMKMVQYNAEVDSNDSRPEVLASKDPFFFFVDTWMKDKEHSLAAFLGTSQ